MRNFSFLLVFIIIFDSVFGQSPVFKLSFGNHLLSNDTPCTNMDFEDCSFNGWELFKGDIPGTSQFSYTNITPDSSLSFHSITNGGNDALVPVSVNYPGGNCSVLLGDGQFTGAKGASMKQTFFVDSNNSFLTFRYAVVLEDPAHPINEQPYFRVRVYDSTGTSLPCGQYDVIAGPVNSGGDPDFIVVGDVSYKDWTTEFVNVDNYQGQNLTIEYIVGDCAQGGHFGYAYLDGACGNNAEGVRAVYPNGCGDFPVELHSIYNGNNFLWNTGDTTPSVSADSNGIYLVTVTTNNGCSRSFSYNLQNNVTANADFSFANSCSGNPVIFSDLSTVAGGTITDWEWDFGDSSALSYMQNPQHTFDSSGNYNVTLNISTSSGCTEDTTISVSIINSFSPSIIGPDSVCLNGGEIVFISSDSGGAWMGSGITDSINGNFNPALAGEGTHLIGYFLSGICPDTGFHQVVVNENPFLIMDSIHHIRCYGQSDGAFFTSGSGGMTPYTYFWGNGCLSCNPYNLVAGTYLYFISDAKGCSDSSEIIITQPDSIQLTISGVSEILCEGENATIGVNVSGGIFPFYFEWTNGDTTQTILADSSQFYKVTVTDANGCTNIASVSINFYPAPQVDLGNDTSIFENDTLILNAGNNGSSYLWSSGEITQSITVGSAGEYFVVITDSNDCSGSDTVIVMVISSVFEIFIRDGYHVYPNPANENFFIEKNNSFNAEVVIYNALGKIILKSNIKNPKSEFNISSFPKGIYFLQVSVETTTHSEKIIIE